jgi:hypothetical protein
MPTPHEGEAHEGQGERYGAALHSPYPQVVIALVLELSQVRAHAIVGSALRARFPTEAAWIAATNSPVFLELVEEFALCIQQLRDVLASPLAADPEHVQRLFSTHYDRSLAALTVFAEDLGVAAEDLLAVLVNTEGRLAGKATDQDFYHLQQRVLDLEAHVQGLQLRSPLDLRTTAPPRDSTRG